MSKQSSRSKNYSQLSPINQKNNDNGSVDGVQDLLQVGGVKININKLEKYAPQPKSSFTSARKKSHKVLGIDTSDNRSLQPFKTRQRKRGFSTQNVQKQEVKMQIQMSALEKSLLKKEQTLQKQIQLPAQKEEKQTQFHFKEKKMRIGKKIKNDRMKQFIMETLSKGRAQSNCLTIHKGTAQCSYSPKKELQKSPPKHQKYPLKLVQQGSERKIPNRGQLQRVLPPRVPRLKNQGETPSTSIRLPSLNQNNKWVEMARKMQKGGNVEEQIKQEIQVQQTEQDKEEPVIEQIQI